MILHEKLNPYRLAFGKIYRTIFKDIWSTLKWEISAEKKGSEKFFRDVKNSYKGQKAVILCNGPSLLTTDFSLLENTFTIGINKINLLFDQHNFRPSLIIAFDSLLNQQNIDFFKIKSDIPKILTYKSSTDVGVCRNDLVYAYHLADESFCYDPSHSLSDRGNTVYIALQILYFMGFQEIALIGADHNYPDIKPKEIIKNDGNDQLHFHKDYHKSGTATQNPDKLQMEINYRDARFAYESKGRKIINATEGGNLEVFERMSLKEFLDYKMDAAKS